MMLGSLVAGSGQMYAQSTLYDSESPNGPVNLIGNDAAILDSDEAKKDLPCTVTPVKPILGFDLRFHSGYDITIPLKELSGNGDTLTIVFRVASGTAKTSPVYFSQKYNVPDIDADASGNAYLGGGFDIGEGDYHVDWLMRDRIERVCSSNWDISAALTGRDQTMKLPIERDSIQTSDVEFFKDEPAVARIDPDNGPDKGPDSGPDTARKAPLKVKVLINFAPQQGNASSMQPIDISALVSILRNISREPRIRKFSLVAFNMNEQRVVYRNDNADQIDFPKLGKALATLKFGMIDYKKLADPHSGSDFLTKLVTDELPNSNADAVIFVGPKVMQADSVPPDNLRDLANVSVPIFYMNYNLFPVQNPWRDPIGNVVKRLRGAEYTIARPRDLWTSWSDIMSRIVKLKLVTVETTSSH
jgi:hypothetical protein